MHAEKGVKDVDDVGGAGNGGDVGDISDRSDRERAKSWPANQEEEGRERLRFLADMYRRTSQPFWAAYLDGRIIAFNRNCCELLGYPEEKLRTLDLTSDLTPLEWRGIEARALEYLHLTRQPQLYEKEYIRQDGSRIPVEIFVHPVCDFEGNIQYYYAFITDITEWKKARKTISESQSRPKRLPSISSPFIYSCKRSGDYPYTFVRKLLMVESY